jgi:hypothetical protein
MRKCWNPRCSDRECIKIQFSGDFSNFNNPKNTDNSNQKDSVVSGNSSSESSASTSSASSESYDSDSSSGDSLFSSSSSASSASSSSEQVVPNLILRKKGRPALINSKLNQKKEEKVVVVECNDPNCADSLCNDPKCTDSNCNAQLAQSGHKCSDLNCTDKNCITSANSSLSPSCTDPHCSSCENGHHDHNSNVRNAFLGIAGVILLAMIGYMTYIKIKAKRSRNLISKVTLPTETIQN